MSTERVGVGGMILDTTWALQNLCCGPVAFEIILIFTLSGSDERDLQKIKGFKVYGCA
jgi:hypothetical protein